MQQVASRAKGSRVSKRKRPEWNRGAGFFRYREAPPPEAVTEQPVDVPITLESYPACGSSLKEEQVAREDRIDSPRPPRSQLVQSRV